MRQWVVDAAYLMEMESSIGLTADRCKLDAARRAAGKPTLVPDFMLSPITDGECLVFCITPTTTVKELHRLVQYAYGAVTIGATESIPADEGTTT